MKEQINKIFTLQELCQIVASHVGIGPDTEYNVRINFNKEKDNYIFKFKKPIK